MDEGMIDMLSMSRKIESYLKEPLKKPTRKEAIQRLQECGILDKHNQVKPAYKKIIVAKENG